MKKLIALIAIGSLAACAPTTRVTSLTDRTAVIDGSGSIFNSATGVTQSMLRAAARYAMENDFAYFQIVDTRDNSYTTSWNTPGSAYTSCGGGSCFSTFSPGSSIPMRVPAGSIAVRFYRDGEVDPRGNGIIAASSVHMD